MNRKKRTHNSRKGSPLSIDLRDFLMYSNPSRFAPKVRKTGGEAYPQAPTMDQFFSYGAPTPQTPFVFQEGGAMSFEDPKPNKVSNFLEKIKKKGYEALQKEMEEEGMMMDDAYNQASIEMDTVMMQWGGGWSGGYDTNFDAANQWNEASDAAYNSSFDSAANFLDYADAFANTQDDTYIKKVNYDYTPTEEVMAKYGRELKRFQGNKGSSQFRPEDIQAARDAWNNAMGRQSGAGIYPGNGRPTLGVNGGWQPFQQAFPQTASAQPVVTKKPGAGVESPFTGGFQGYMPARQPNWRTSTYNPGDGSIFYTPNNSGSSTSSGTPVATSKKPTSKDKPTEKPVAEDTPPEGTTTGKDANGNDVSVKPPATENKTPENKTPEEIKKEAADAGMSPQQYMTFLTHADVKMGPLGRRLRRASFDFSTYGPGMNPITASVPGSNNQQNPNTVDASQNSEDVPGGRGNQNRQQNRDGFLRRIFGRPDEQSRWNTEKGPKREGIQSPIGTSQFNPEGYSDKNYMSDLRNQRATDRLTRLGERIDRNIQRERSLDDFYNAPISDRMQRLRERDLRRYNRIAGRFDRNEYTEPTRAMGGGMGYFQPGGENDIYGTAGYSTDGYDTTEREDYAGNTIYETPPATGPTEVGKGNLDVKFGHYNPYEADMILAGMNVFRGALNNREANKNKNIFKDKMSADQVFTKIPGMDRGDYTANEGYFRPNKMVPIKNSGYNFESPYAKMGGSYKKGGEYYLSDEEIQRIIDMGGEVEFLED